MKILLTGNRGFIGTYLENILQNECNIIGYDLRDGYDIRDSYQVDELFDKERPDTVIHCAALAGVRRSTNHPKDYFNTNVFGTHNVLVASERYGIQHFINFSSSSVYGSFGIGQHHRPLKEDDMKNPVSFYGISKLAAEFIVNMSSIATTIVRPFTVYGENGRKDQVIYKWLDCIKRGKPFNVYSEKKQFPTRGFTHIKDLADGICKILDRDTGLDIHATYNLGGDVAISVKQLLDIFKEECEKQMMPFMPKIVDLPKGDSLGNLADTEKARAELGWKPAQNFKEKVIEIIQKELCSKT